MHVFDIIGTAASIALAPLILTVAVGTKIAYFIPLLIKWNRAEASSQPEGMQLSDRSLIAVE